MPITKPKRGFEEYKKGEKMSNITLKLDKEEAVKILLNEFDEFKPSTWDEELLKGNRFENKEEFDFERKLFEDFLDQALECLQEIKLEWADYFIYNKELIHFEDIKEDELESKKQDALFVCEERKLMIMNF